MIFLGRVMMSEKSFLIEVWFKEKCENFLRNFAKVLSVQKKDIGSLKRSFRENFSKKTIFIVYNQKKEIRVKL